ncbi:hypothetical protein OICFNHDK_3417 [Methylobacterium bullatum]|uniref:Uncharacterized protein n=1 Tax=Methylobacterium bullatum TaxID=570505 RepID=A0AAV4ZA74_9HYPH|nr:hypothetical protein [Methylobacterium bullatum]GJD40941.1 hypothetical protein OICFNHDK_3417 [Methylobacterium bullatum]
MSKALEPRGDFDAEALRWLARASRDAGLSRWHIAGDLVVPDTVTVSPLRSHAPELKPVETVWQFMRDDRLGDMIFASHEDIPDRCCAAWNKLVAQPRRIMFPRTAQLGLSVMIRADWYE